MQIFIWKIDLLYLHNYSEFPLQFFLAHCDCGTKVCLCGKKKFLAYMMIHLPLDSSLEWKDKGEKC